MTGPSGLGEGVGTGEGVGPGGGAGEEMTPVPSRRTECGPPALSVKTRDALRPPSAAGVKVTLYVWLAPGASVPGPPVKAKSPGFPPARLTPLIVRGAVPVLLTVRLCGALVVPTRCAPNERCVAL